MLVAGVREFIDQHVRPSVRERDHANQYPEAWIEQMRRIGIYGLAVPAELHEPDRRDRKTQAWAALPTD